MYVERMVWHPTCSHIRPRAGLSVAFFPRSGGPKTRSLRLIPSTRPASLVVKLLIRGAGREGLPMPPGRLPDAGMWVARVSNIARGGRAPHNRRIVPFRRDAS